MDNAPPFPFEPSIPHPIGAPSGPAAGGFERLARVEQPEHFEALLHRHAPELAQPDAALRILREVAPTRFFAGAAEAGTAAALTATLPAHRAEVVAEAEAL